MPLEPNGTPEAVVATAASSKNITVSWNPVTADDRNGIIKGYIVNYQALPDGDIIPKFRNIISEQQNDKQTVLLDDLNEFTNYSISVLAFTVIGNGPASVAQVVETLEDSKSLLIFLFYMQRKIIYFYFNELYLIGFFFFFFTYVLSGEHVRCSCESAYFPPQWPVFNSRT